MKGIVFNLLEQVVTQEHGESTWDALLEKAGVDGAYTSLGSYPDEELARLVQAASEALGLTPNDVIRWFGRTALPILARSYPGFFTPHRSTRSFLLTLNDIIHLEVRKLYPGANLPVFHFDPSAEDLLLMGYRSQRQLCAFGHGLIEGAAVHFGEVVEVDQPECMQRGDERCVFRVSFKGPRGA